MNFFQESKRSFVTLGITSNERTFNRKALLVIACYCVDDTLHCIHLLRVANTFDEYSESIFTTTTTVMITVLFIVIAIKWKNISELIDGIDELAEKSMVWRHFRLNRFN